MKFQSCCVLPQLMTISLTLVKKHRPSDESEVVKLEKNFSTGATCIHTGMKISTEEPNAGGLDLQMLATLSKKVSC